MTTTAISTPTVTTAAEPLSRQRASALIAAPLLLLVGSALHPAESSDAGVVLRNVAHAETRWWVSHVLLMVGAGLLIAGLHTLLHHVDRAAPRLARLGTALAGVGAAAIVALIATESTAAWALSRSTDIPSAATTFEDVTSAAEVLFIPFVLAFHLGLVLLAVALRRTSGTPALQWIALLTASVLLFVGNAAFSTWLSAAAGAAMAMAMVPVGLQALRGRTA